MKNTERRYEKILKNKHLNSEIRYVYQFLDKLSEKNIKLESLNYYDPLLVEFRAGLDKSKYTKPKDYKPISDVDDIVIRMNKQGYTNKQIFETVDISNSRLQRIYMHNGLTKKHELKLLVDKDGQKIYFANQATCERYFGFNNNALTNLREKKFVFKGMTFWRLEKPMILRDLKVGSYYVMFDRVEQKTGDTI